MRVLSGRLQLVGLHERGACTDELPLALQHFSDQLCTHDTLRHGELRVWDRTRRCLGFIGVPQAAFGKRELERDRRVVTNAERVAPSRRRTRSRDRAGRQAAGEHLVRADQPRATEPVPATRGQAALDGWREPGPDRDPVAPAVSQPPAPHLQGTPR